jgi:peptidyl-prolyl cis-trans isomerase D
MGLMVAIVIGLAMGAFILGDILNSGSKLMKPKQMEIAEINGTSISYPEFQKKVEELGDVYKMNSQKKQIDENTWIQIREQVWQEYLQQNIIGKAAQELGITVTSQELFDLVQGPNPHPIIQQLFRNPQTGQVDKSVILQFLKSLETTATQEQKTYWFYIENQIREDRIRSKYNDLIAKGLYVTTDEAKQSLDLKNKNTSFQYLAVSYTSIPDSTVKLSESDLKNYYEKHKDEYKQEKTRKIEYVVFDVLPSASDSAATKKWITESKQDFENAADNAQYVNVNSDTPFDPEFYKKSEIKPEALADWAFTAKPGELYGPFQENGEYKLVKLDARKMMPDSVEASHILITPQKAGSMEKAKAEIDSLKNVIEKGGNFAELAKKYSEDTGSAAKGGDLGWFKRHQMVPEFEEAAFTGEVNKLYVTTTRFGVHLIKPTKMGKPTEEARLATLTRKVDPSNETYQKVYAITSKFASENTNLKAFNKAVVDQKLTKRQATLTENENQIAGLEGSRSLIRAAFQAEVGNIIENTEGSTIFEYGNKFVIATLTGATEEGTESFDDAKIAIEIALRKEKKGEMLAEKLKNAQAGQTELGGIAAKFSTDVKDASGVNFNSFSVPGLGFEPAVIGTVCSTPEGKISVPIIGNNAVYLAKVTAVNQTNDTNFKAEQTRLGQTLAYQASAQAFDALKKRADIVDKRSKFY